MTDGVGRLTSSVSEVGRNVYLDPMLFREICVLWSEPVTNTRPSCKRIASEWYILATMVDPRMDIREPTGLDGS